MRQADSPSTSLTLLDCLGRMDDEPKGRTAWGEFAVRYERTIRDWCRRWGAQGSDADDLVQQLLLGIRETVRGYDPKKGRFRSWLWVVTRNAYTNLVARRPGAGASVLWENLAARGDLEQEIARQARRELLDAALGRVQARVNPDDWAIFHALSFGGRRGEEVAAAHGRTTAAVLMVKSRVLKKVKEQIAELGGDDREWGTPL